VELAAADVDLALVRLAERHNARVEAVDHRPERHEIQCGVGGGVQGVLHAALVHGPVDTGGYPSPLSPSLGGGGVGGGGAAPACVPLTPGPSPPSTGERGAR